MGVGYVPQEPIHSPGKSAQLQRRKHRGTSKRRHLTENRSRIARGIWAEDLVARYYESLGYQVIARNFRFKGGELDVIAMRGRLLIVCEVKARATSSHGLPAEAVTPQKQRRIRLGAIEFLKMCELSGMQIHFDVASVLGSKLEIIEDAF